MSAPFLTAISLFAAALLLAAGVLTVGRLLRPPAVAIPPPAPTPDLSGTGHHSWHLVALGVLFQVVLVPLLVWGLSFRDLARAHSAALWGPLAFLGVLALGLARAWRAGLLDTGPVKDAGDSNYHGDLSD